MRQKKQWEGTLQQMKMRQQQSNTCGTLGKQSRGKFIELQAYLKQNKTTQKTPPISSNKQPPVQKLEKEKQIKPNVSRRKEIIKIRPEINEIEFKKWYKRSMNPRAGSLKR